MNTHPVMTYDIHGNLVAKGSKRSSEYEEMYLRCISMPHGTQEWRRTRAGTSSASLLIVSPLT